MKIKESFKTRQAAMEYLFARGWKIFSQFDFVLWFPQWPRHRRGFVKVGNRWKINRWTVDVNPARPLMFPTPHLASHQSSV